jgi:hypothetical protein
MKFILRIQASHIVLLYYTNYLTESNPDSGTTIGTCVRPSPSDDLKCFDPECAFTHSSLYEIKNHIQMEHYNNKKLVYDVLLFLSSFREGSLVDSVNYENDTTSLDNEERVSRDEGIMRVKKKRSRETGQGYEKDNDKYAPRKIKKIRSGRVDIEIKDRNGPTLQPLPLRQSFTLRPLKRSVKPLNMIPFDAQALQVRKSLDGRREDKIESNEVDEPESSAHSPSQMLNLQPCKPLLFKPLVGSAQMSTKGRYK